MSRTARVAVVLTATLVGALVTAAVLGGAALRDTGGADPVVDRTGAAGLAPTPDREPGIAGPADRRRAAGDPRAVRPPRARPAGLDRRPTRSAVGPTRLLVPGAGIRMPVAPRGVDRQGLMALPDSPFTAGWYRWGAAPGDRRGAVVVAGHVDTAEQGIGPLARAAALRPGARIVLTGAGRATTYHVTSVRRVPKRVLDLPALFRRTGPPALHLVTCGGEFDPVARSYRDNVVVVAERRSRERQSRERRS